MATPFIEPQYEESEQLTRTVIRERWQEVGDILDRKEVSSDQRLWAVRKAKQEADDEIFDDWIWPYCEREDVNDVYWPNISDKEVEKWCRYKAQFGKDISCDWLRDATIEEGLFSTTVKPYCRRDQLNSTLRKLIDFDKDVLKHGISCSKPKWPAGGTASYLRNNENEDHYYYYAVEYVLISDNIIHSIHIELKLDITSQMKRIKDVRKLFVTSKKDLIEYNLPEYNSNLLSLRILMGEQKSGLHKQFTEQSKLSAKKRILMVVGDTCIHHDYISFILPPSGCTESFITFIFVYGKLLHEKVNSAIRLNQIDDVSQTIKKWIMNLVMKWNTEFIHNSSCLEKSSIETLLAMLSDDSLDADVEYFFLKKLLYAQQWDIIMKLDITKVREELRREMFQAAVEEYQWPLVQQWADHSIYDDQRWWAMQKARKNKQWAVNLQMSRHGLTDEERALAHYILYTEGHWSVVMNMLDTDDDFRVVRQFVEGKKTKNCKRRTKMLRCAEQLFKTSHKYSWQRHFTPKKTTINLLIENKLDVWQNSQTVIEIVKLYKWGTCRDLVEHGVEVSDWATILDQLLDHRQWILVARAMEYDVGDAVRLDVMWRALEQKEGSLVWHCIKTMTKGITSKEREMLFKRAICRAEWQVLKSLIEVEDDLGLEQRDKVLQLAVQLRQWVMVDYCIQFPANINMKDKDGDNLLQLAAMRDDWEAVRELVRRGGDPSQLDSRGVSVLHRAAAEDDVDMDTVITLLEYHADLFLSSEDYIPTRSTCYDIWTPIELLMMNDNLSGIIDDVLVWSPNVHLGVLNEIFTELTTLHDVCESGEIEPMFYLVARGVHPLEVTENGDSPLMYAVMGRSRETVAESIRLGFSTHQQEISDEYMDPDDLSQIPDASWHREAIPRNPEPKTFISPMTFAIVHDMRIICAMLYESGACSNKELFCLYKHKENIQRYFFQKAWLGLFLPSYLSRKSMQNWLLIAGYIKTVATNPRTLKSLCRLVVSHALNVRGKRHKDVDFLTCLDSSLKDYVLFIDLTDPNFGSGDYFIKKIVNN